MSELAEILFDRSYQGLCLVDRHGKVVRVNRVLERQVGLSSQEMSGKSVLDIFRGADDLAAVLRCLDPGDTGLIQPTPVRVSVRGALLDGELTRVKLADGRNGVLIELKPVPAAASVSVDGEALARDELLRYQPKMDRIVRLLSHDLRSPLAVIQAHAQYVERQVRKGEGDEATAKSMRSILSAAGQMNSLIGELAEAGSGSEDPLLRGSSAQSSSRLHPDEEFLL